MPGSWFKNATMTSIASLAAVNSNRHATGKRKDKNTSICKRYSLQNRQRYYPESRISDKDLDFLICKSPHTKIYIQ
jgi:hypothetical protein